MRIQRASPLQEVLDLSADGVDGIGVRYGFRVVEIVGFLPCQIAGMTVQYFLEKRNEAVQTTGGLASDRGHHEQDVGISVKTDEYLRLNPEQIVVESFLFFGKLNVHGPRLAGGKFADIAAPRPVDDTGKGMQPFQVRDELYSIIFSHTAIGE